jgi:hypothetical protein
LRGDTPKVLAGLMALARLARIEARRGRAGEWIAARRARVVAC